MPGLIKLMESPMPELFQVATPEEPTATSPQPESQTAPVEAAVEPIAVPDAFVSIPEDALPQPPVPANVEPAEATGEPEKAERPRDKAEREYHERAQDRIKNFVDHVRAANKSEEAVPVKQPVSPAILDQTAREMAAGKAMSEYHAGLKAQPRKGPSPREVQAQGSSTPVFRPGDGAGSKEQAAARLK